MDEIRFEKDPADIFLPTCSKEAKSRMTQKDAGGEEKDPKKFLPVKGKAKIRSLEDAL